jgi:mannitol/fructose-specific phosphotransferase system IIA component (Ntr-type)
MSRESQGNSISLLDALKESHLAVDCEASSWEEAVWLAGEILVEKEVAKTSYIEAMVETIRDLGPYCVIAPGIAMPHARPDDHVLDTGFSLVTLKEPVEFGSQENDPVDIVIGFAANDKNRHVQALREIAQLFIDKTFVDQVRTASSTRKLYDIIQSKRT